MAEYRKKQGNQPGRAIANTTGEHRQLKTFKDNRINHYDFEANREGVQMKRTDYQEISTANEEMDAINVAGHSFSICTHSEIKIPPKVMPKAGTATSGSALWAGILLDSGYTNPRTATRLHVINSHFGGVGQNDGGNLHPGSQRLNKRHLIDAENSLKARLADPDYDNSTLVYISDFSGMTKTINPGDAVTDPTINCKVIVDGERETDLPVGSGDGMHCPATVSANTVDDVSDTDD